MTTIDAEARALLETAEVTLQMDEEAFREFYARTARVLWAYLARLTGDRQLADDLLQDAFYRLLRTTTPLDGDVHRRRYLFRIATNLARDRVRRRRTAPDLIPADGHEGAGAHDLSAHGYERRLDLTKAFGRLRPRERALLWLAYAEGADHHEIADVLGVRHGSVKVLLQRARRRLAALIDRRGGHA